MKSLVCISKTADTSAKIAFTPDGSSFIQDGVQFIINPYDEWYALVRALELQEKNGGTVDLIHCGNVSSDPIIRKALAIGGDQAVRVDMEPISSMDAAVQIAEHAKSENYDIIFCGKETIDYNGGAVGSMVAGLLNLPFICNAVKLELNGNKATVEYEIEGGVVIAEIQTPFVLSAAKGLAEQRIPNMRGIMMAKTKPLIVKASTGNPSHTFKTTFSLPPAKSSVRLFASDDMDALVQSLHSEAKVI